MSEPLAPVIPLFGDRSAAPTGRRTAAGSGDDVAATEDQWHTSWTAEEVSVAPETPGDDAATERREDAEKHLLKKLRTRSLSEREARSFLREYTLDEPSTQYVIDSMLRLGYLDDRRLAEQLIHAGTTRKGQGRQAIGQALAQRGIARDVADEALGELVNDDAERALEFARQKARSMHGLDRETAVRRLTGQLARRGYGSVALSAARQALSETTAPRVGGVRFE